MGALSFLLWPSCLLFAALSPCHDGLLALWNHKLRSVLREVAIVMGFYHSNREVNNAGIPCLIYSLIFIENMFLYNVFCL